MKILLYVEGQTEMHLKSFFKRWLDHRVKPPVSLAPIHLSGVGNYLKEFDTRIGTALRKPGIAGAIGLIDFYGAPLPYPNGTVEEKYKWAARELERRVNHPRFRQHFAVHETEAWLLSDTGIFPRAVSEDLRSTAAPEKVNSQNPPGDRLKGAYRRRLNKTYDKRVEAANLFAKLNPETAYERCPHLKLLLDDLLMLADGRLKSCPPGR